MKEENLRQNIYAEVKRRNMTIGSMGKFLGIDQGNMWRIMHTSKQVSLFTVIKIAKGLGTTIDALLAEPYFEDAILPARKSPRKVKDVQQMGCVNFLPAGAKNESKTC